MRRSIAVPLAVCLLGAFGAGPAWAQGAHLGSHAAYHFDVKQPGMGAQATLPVLRQVELYPSAAYWFVDTGSLWAVNADVKYRLPTVAYVGTGLNLARRTVANTSDTDAGLNLIGGIESRAGWIHPFAEGRVILNSGSAFQVAGGVNVTLRR